MEKEKETSNKPNFIKEKWKKFKEYINKKYEKQLKYFKERKKKVDRYFVIILSMLTSLSIYILYERKIINQENIYVLMAILTICFIVYIFSIRKNFKSKNINELDKAIFFSNIFLITSFFMIIVIKSIKNRNLLFIFNLFNRLIHNDVSLSFTVIITSVIIVLTVFSLILIIRRFFLFKKFNNAKETQLSTKSQSQLKEQNNKKMHSLNEIYNNSFELDDTNKIAIKDSDDDIPDAFKIDRTKDELKIAINKYSTIGVVGKWGSGKSTLINSTITEINKNNYIIINDFDPWAIKSQDALILAMYNTITENLGENIGFFKRKKIQNALINISTNIPYIGKGIGSYFENRVDDYTEYKEIKADLEEKLENSDKRLVFIIDNLDRMKSDNVLFLLNLIETLFKLPNITYILPYDKNRLNKIFKDNRIDLRYLEKIINTEIFMPVLNRNIIETCLKNVLNIYRYNHFYSDDIIKNICKRFTNIRQFICFCNSLSKKLDIFDYLYNTEGEYLDIECDYFIIQAIKFFDYNVFLKIYKDKDIFIEQTDLNNFLCSEYEDYTDLMNLLFSKTETKIKNNSILNPILFNLCFLDINDIIEETIQLINILESNSIKYNKQQSEAMTQGMYKELKESKDNEEFYQKQKLIEFLNISFCSTESDIIYSFNLIGYVIKFKNITFRQKEILWNLLIQCSSHNENSIYSYTLETEQNETLKDLIDDNIRILLNYIFQSFNKKEKKEFIDNLKGKFNHNRADYFKNLIICKCIFGDYIINLLQSKEANYIEINDLIKDLYTPLINFPVFLWKKNEILDLINKINLETNQINEIYDIFISYIDILYNKIKENGSYLYYFIELFALKKIENNIYTKSKDLERKKSKLTEKDIYNLMDKYPPKDETEEKIKRDFKIKYPI